MDFRHVVGAVASVLAIAIAFDVRAEEAPPSIERQTLVAEALRDHPAVRAAGRRADAIRRAGEAEGSLPPPDAMVQIWQVPLAKPYAIGDAQMIMFGVGQTFPAVGARPARQRAAEREADAEKAIGEDTARQIRRDVSHTFADYVEATSRHRIHVEHRSLAQRTLELARARYAGGGSLSDVAQAEVDVARTDADVVTDSTRIDAARGKLNALLGRPATATLGAAVIGPPETSAWDLATALAKARETRPELRATEARRDARREEARAAEREATIPSFSVAALYFAPTTPMPEHGYGVNASVSLPWLSGEGRAKRDARRASAEAAQTEIEATRRPIEADVAMQEANVRAAAARFAALRDRALPASKRALEVAQSGYETGRVDVLTVLSSRRSVVDVETEIIAARATLDHALADLEAAVGADLPRKPLADGGSDGH